MPRFTEDDAETVRSLAETQSVTQMAAHFSCSYSTVSRFCASQGIELGTKRGRHLTPEQIQEICDTRGAVSPKVLAERYSRSVGYIQLLLAKHGAQAIHLDEENWLHEVKHFHSFGYNAYQIAQRFNAPPGAVWAAYEKLGIEDRFNVVGAIMGYTTSTRL